VIRVVRTSTTEVDRRKAVRHQIDLPCSLDVAGQAAIIAYVTDISEGGAAVRGGPPLPPGTHGALHLHSIGFCHASFAAVKTARCA
jgi:methyl-accepting chemotaxis protein